MLFLNEHIAWEVLFKLVVKSRFWLHLETFLFILFVPSFLFLGIDDVILM